MLLRLCIKKNETKKKCLEATKKSSFLNKVNIEQLIINPVENEKPIKNSEKLNKKKQIKKNGDNT